MIIDGIPRCWICSKPMEEMLLSKQGDKWVLSGKWAFHYFSVHGIPMEMFPEYVREGIGIVVDKVGESIRRTPFILKKFYQFKFWLIRNYYWALKHG